MIEFLKSWITKEKDFATEQSDAIIEAVSALLLEAAVIDGQIDDIEMEQSKHAICNFFNLTEEEADQIIQNLRGNAGQKHEFHSLTKQIRDQFDYEERMYILSMLWQIVLADDVVGSLEANLMRRLSGLLFISDVDSGKAKQQARIRLGIA